MGAVSDLKEELSTQLPEAQKHTRTIATEVVTGAMSSLTEQLDRWRSVESDMRSALLLVSCAV